MQELHHFHCLLHTILPAFRSRPRLQRCSHTDSSQQFRPRFLLHTSNAFQKRRPEKPNRNLGALLYLSYLKMTRNAPQACFSAETWFLAEGHKTKQEEEEEESVDYLPLLNSSHVFTKYFCIQELKLYKMGLLFMIAFDSCGVYGSLIRLSPFRLTTPGMKGVVKKLRVSAYTFLENLLGTHSLTEEGLLLECLICKQQTCHFFARFPFKFMCVCTIQSALLLSYTFAFLSD